MKNGTVIFMLGMTVGSVITFLSVRKYYKELADEEIQSVKDTLKKKVDAEAEKEADKKNYEVLCDDLGYTGYPTPEQSKELHTMLVENIELLKSDGLNNFEIGQKLGIGEATVRALLNSGNKKLSDAEEDEDEGYTTKDRPYVISREEFGQRPEYDKVYLDFYSDSILTNEYDEILENVDEVLGNDWQDHIGDEEEGFVCVRNDQKETDYEICQTNQFYNQQ